jgi:hypothetical protein
LEPSPEHPASNKTLHVNRIAMIGRLRPEDAAVENRLVDIINAS